MLRVDAVRWCHLAKHLIDIYILPCPGLGGFNLEIAVRGGSRSSYFVSTVHMFFSLPGAMSSFFIGNAAVGISASVQNVQRASV